MAVAVDAPTDRAFALPAVLHRLLDDGHVAEAWSGAERLALARALKDACHAAWSSEPQTAVRAAAASRQLLPPPGHPGWTQRWCREADALSAWTDGIADAATGRMSQALQHLQRAEEAFRGLGLDRDAAQTRVPRIMVLAILGDLAGAAECGAVAQREFVQQGDWRSAAKVSLNLGSLEMRRDAYRAAAGHYRVASVQFARAGDHEHSVMADIGLGDALGSTGEADEARRMYSRARMRAGSHRLPVLRAMADESLALLDLACGRFREALQGLERARALYQELDAPRELAVAERQLGDAYLELRLLPEALALFDQAQARLQQLQVSADLAWTGAQRGRVLALMGRRAEGAAALQQAALAFREADNAVGAAAVELARAELALADGQCAQALDLAQRAARLFERAQQAEGQVRAELVAAQSLWQASRCSEAGRRFAAVLERAIELNLLTCQVRARTGVGLACAAAGQPDQARAAFEAAVAGAELQRRTLPGDELRGAFLGDHLLPYRELLRLALRGGTADEVLVRLDAYRARALGDRLAAGPAPARSEDEAIATLRARLGWLQRRAGREGEATELPPALADEIRRVEADLLEQGRRLRLRQDAAEAGDAHGTMSPGVLQGLMGEGDALVEYGVVDDELFACVVTARGVVLVRHLASWSALREAEQALRFQLDTLRHGSAPWQDRMALLTQRVQRRLQQLHGMVWAPLAAALAGIRRVMVVPHAPLDRVPFAALHDGEGPLARRLAFAYAPSAQAAQIGLARTPRPPRQVLALGESSRLPHAGVEARRVAEAFPQGIALLGRQATLAALRSGAAAADVLHLACHGHYRGDNPMFSSLQLADEQLTVEAAEALRLPAASVVLSACESGLAGGDRGDEMFGLVRAFLVAGAARVLASLWPVEDEVTAVLMDRFYRAWHAGAAPAEALRRAQCEVMASHPHPFHWAAFQLHAGW